MAKIEIGNVNVASLKRYLNKTMAISKSQVIVFDLSTNTIACLSTNSDMSIAKRWKVDIKAFSEGFRTDDILEGGDKIYLGFFDATNFLTKALKFETINLTLNVDFDTSIQANVVKSVIVQTGDIKLNVSTSNVSILIKSVEEYERLNNLFDQDLSKNGKFSLSNDVLNRILQLSSLGTSTNTKPFVSFSTKDGHLSATDETFEYKMFPVDHDYAFSIMKRMLSVVCREPQIVQIVNDTYAFFKSEATDTECCVSLATHTTGKDMASYEGEQTGFEDFVDIDALINA